MGCLLLYEGNYDWSTEFFEGIGCGTTSMCIWRYTATSEILQTYTRKGISDQ